MIEVVCPSCQSSLRVKDEHSGKRGKCPKCRGDIVVPFQADLAALIATKPDLAALIATKPDPAPDETQRVAKPRRSASDTAPGTQRPRSGESAVRRKRGPASLEEVIARLNTSVPRPAPSLRYRLTLWAVALLTLMLPIVYLAMVVGLAWLWWQHLLGRFMVMPTFGIRGAIYTILFFYIGPLIAGGVVLVAMVRPLFSLGWSRSQAIPVRREDAPLLWELVDRICRAIGSPMPRAILVDARVGASARLRSGLWSVPTGHLVLIIGLPLVANLRIDQFIGVLSHEFGHFTQRSALRLTAIVDFVNRWFHRACAASENADEALGGFRDRNLSGIWEMMLSIMQFIIAVPRGVLWVLLQLSDALCRQLLWEQEFDADQIAARIVGSECCSGMLRQALLLGEAEKEAMRLSSERWQNANQLPTDLPTMVNFVLERRREKLLRLAKSAYSDKEASTTSPPMKVRAQRIRDLEEEGIVSSDLGCTELFQDFEGYASKATFAYFHQMVGDRIKRAKYVSPYSLVPGDD